MSSCIGLREAVQSNSSMSVVKYMSECIMNRRHCMTCQAFHVHDHLHSACQNAVDITRHCARYFEGHTVALSISDQANLLMR